MGLGRQFKEGQLTVGGTMTAINNIAQFSTRVMDEIERAADYIERLRTMASNPGFRHPLDFDLMKLLADILESQQFLIKDTCHQFHLQTPINQVPMHSWPQILSKVIALLLTFMVQDVLADGPPGGVHIQAEGIGNVARIVLSANGSESRMEQIVLGGIYELVTQNLHGNLSFGWTEETGVRFVIILPCNVEAVSA